MDVIPQLIVLMADGEPVKVFLHPSDAETLLAACVAYEGTMPPPPRHLTDTGWGAYSDAKQAWRAAHPAGQRFAGSGANFRLVLVEFVA